MQRYVGKYQFNPAPLFEIIIDHDTLYGQVGNDRKELIPFGKHQFFARNLHATILFKVDAKGKVISLRKIRTAK
ncbi:hypothetical protein H9X96_05555 [Pedobacter sp. N36a]|nr:hypothetical protein [Pedobacter sp. N36a]